MDKIKVIERVKHQKIIGLTIILGVLFSGLIGWYSYNTGFKNGEEEGRKRSHFSSLSEGKIAENEDKNESYFRKFIRVFNENSDEMCR